MCDVELGKDKQSEKMSGRTTATSADGEQKPKLKPCCACPETKVPRDKCIMEYGQENCKDLIEAHRECMRKAGFNI